MTKFGERIHFSGFLQTMNAAAAALTGILLLGVPVGTAVLSAQEARNEDGSIPSEEAFRLSIVVMDGESEQPVQDALVRLNGSRDRVTDARGMAFWERLAEGTYVLTVQHLGYEPLTREMNHTADFETPLRVTLRPRAIALDQLVITGRRTLGSVGERFEVRRRIGRGDFITPEVLDERRHERLSQILERHSGLQRTCGRSGCQLISRRAVAGFGNCRPDYYLDGLRFTLLDADIDHFVSSEEVAMVEVYLGPSQTPVEYNRGNSACGVVLIWTRSGIR